VDLFSLAAIAQSFSDRINGRVRTELLREMNNAKVYEEGQPDSRKRGASAMEGVQTVELVYGTVLPAGQSGPWDHTCSLDNYESRYENKRIPLDREKFKDRYQDTSIWMTEEEEYQRLFGELAKVVKNWI
jgi:hypothetical protein